MNMKDFLRKEDVVGSIRLQLRHPSGADKIWIVVEGETDQKLFSKLINGHHVEIEISYGGVNRLLEAVAELLKETDRVLGIRDADFLHLEGKRETGRNIFLTDFHDSEMMLLACDKAYHAVAAEYLRKEKNPLLLREKILKSIAFIGGVRWMNNSENLELNFKGLGFGNFYDGKNLSLDEEKCLNEMMKRSPNTKREMLREEIRLKIKDVSYFLNLCNGHDFQKAFALCVNSDSNKGVNDAQISKEFRIAYRFEDFQETNLYRQLKDWSDTQARAMFR
ncbi:MAG: DUF4435 domain-containing protein [Desulfobacterales bacterium]